MNDEQKLDDEVQLTALLMGELSADEAQALRDRMGRDPKLAELHERLRLTLGWVQEACGPVAAAGTGTAGELPLKLAGEKRSRLLEHFKIIKAEESFGRSYKWAVPVAAMAVLVMMIGGIFVLPQFEAGGARSKALAQRKVGEPEMNAPAGGREEVVQLETAYRRAEDTRILAPPAVPKPQIEMRGGGMETKVITGFPGEQNLTDTAGIVPAKNADVFSGLAASSTADRKELATQDKSSPQASFGANFKLDEGRLNERADTLGRQVGQEAAPWGQVDSAFFFRPESGSTREAKGAGIVDGNTASLGYAFPRAENGAVTAGGASDSLAILGGGFGGGGGIGGGGGLGGGGAGGGIRGATDGVVDKAIQLPRVDLSARGVNGAAAATGPAAAPMTDSLSGPGLAAKPDGQRNAGATGVQGGTAPSDSLSMEPRLMNRSRAFAKDLTVPGEVPNIAKSEGETRQLAEKAKKAESIAPEGLARNVELLRRYGLMPPPGQEGSAVRKLTPLFDDVDGRRGGLAGHAAREPAAPKSVMDFDAALPAGNTAVLEEREVLRERLTTQGVPESKTRAADLPAVPSLQVDESRVLGLRRAPSNVTALTVQPEIQTSTNAFSTFSLNVADVSFKLAAASLEKGVLPEPAQVRSEEFINAFDYRDSEPPPGAPVGFTWERARHPFAHRREVVRFSVKTASAGRQSGRALNLVLLLDNSGSMERADRVRIVREGLRVLNGQLRPEDKVSVITFARTARLRADGVSGAEATAALAEAGRGTPEGGTNIEEALRLGYATAQRHFIQGGINRVVLLTDGAANLGNVDPGTLKRTVVQQRERGIALDGFGIGWEGFNDDLLETLTRNGDGRYGFLNTPEDADSQFARQLAGAFQVAASDVKVQIEFNPRRVTAYRQIGYAHHQLSREQFRDNTVDAAEIGAAESGNALYVLEINPGGEGALAVVRVRYKIPGTNDYREQEWPVLDTQAAAALETAAPSMRLAVVAGTFAEWLADSPHAAEATPDRLLALLQGVPEVYGNDPRPRQLEWMIRQAKSIGR